MNTLLKKTIVGTLVMMLVLSLFAFGATAAETYPLIINGTQVDSDNFDDLQGLGVITDGYITYATNSSGILFTFNDVVISDKDNDIATPTVQVTAANVTIQLNGTSTITGHMDAGGNSVSLTGTGTLSVTSTNAPAIDVGTLTISNSAGVTAKVNSATVSTPSGGLHGVDGAVVLNDTASLTATGGNNGGDGGDGISGTAAVNDTATLTATGGGGANGTNGTTIAPAGTAGSTGGDGVGGRLTVNAADTTVTVTGGIGGNGGNGASGSNVGAGGKGGTGGNGVSGGLTVSASAADSIVNVTGGARGTGGAGGTATTGGTDGAKGADGTGGHGVLGSSTISAGEITVGGGSIAAAFTTAPTLTGYTGVSVISSGILVTDLATNYHTSNRVQITGSAVDTFVIPDVVVTYGYNPDEETDNGEDEANPNLGNAPGGATNYNQITLYTGDLANSDPYSSDKMPTDAGTYTVTVTRTPTNVPDGEPPTIYIGTGNFTVNPKTVTVDSTGFRYEKEYDGNNTLLSSHVVSPPTLNDIISGDDVDINVTPPTSYITAEVHDDGYQDITIGLSGDDAHNYALSSNTLNGILTQINKKNLTITGVTMTAKPFDGTTTATAYITGVTFDGLVSGSLAFGTDYTVSSAQFANSAVGTGKTVTGVVALQDTPATQNYHIDPNDFSVTTGEITKGPYTPTAHPEAITVLYTDTSAKTVDLTAYIPTIAGDVTAIVMNDPTHIAKTETSSLNKTVDFWLDSGIPTANANDTITLTATVATDNYNAFDLTITIQLTEKNIQNLVFSPDVRTVTLGDAPITNTLTGAHTVVKYTSSLPAVATVDENTGLVTFVSAGTTVITATAQADADNAEATAEYTLTVNAGKVNTTLSQLVMLFDKLFSELTGVSLKLADGTVYDFEIDPAITPGVATGSSNLILQGDTVGSVGSGSVKVTFFNSFFARLPSGTHTVTITTNMGNASATFLIPTIYTSSGSNSSGGGYAWYPTGNTGSGTAGGSSSGNTTSTTPPTLTWTPPVSTGGTTTWQPSSSSSSSEESSSSSDFTENVFDESSSAYSSSSMADTEADLDLDDEDKNSLLLPIILAAAAAVIGAIGFILLRRRKNN